MKILIVEDDFYSRKFLHDLLILHHYDCQAAINGEEGLNMIEDFKPDLIVSDIQMPVMNGLEMLEEIRNRKLDIIVIMTTAFGSEEFAIQALRLGANNYLKKPISDNELLPILEKYKSFIENRSSTTNLPGRILQREFTLEFDTNITYVSGITERLMLEIDNLFDINERTNIELGLVELLNNAVEHGNLEITSTEKRAALSNNTLHELHHERITIPEIANRKVAVDFRSDLSGCQWIISDEGNGFDWENVPNPTKDGNLLELSGRGIFITRFLFDELEYIGSGNIVRVKKNFVKSES